MFGSLSEQIHLHVLCITTLVHQSTPVETLTAAAVAFLK